MTQHTPIPQSFAKLQRKIRVNVGSGNKCGPVCPAKAGLFSGRQSHRGRSQIPVVWVAPVEETKQVKPTDKAILGMVSELPGRNASEPKGGPDNLSLWRSSPLVRGEDNRVCRRLTGEAHPSGGVVGTAR